MSYPANAAFTEDRFIAPHTFSENAFLWQKSEELIGAGALAVGFPEGFQISRLAGEDSGRVLDSVGRVVFNLESSRIIAKTMDPQPMILACTSARDAQSLISDEGPRDRRYLSGVKSIDGFHVYCGGMEAAIRRALEYARYADVVCYRTSRFDSGDAQQFAAALRSSFPGKSLGIGLSLSSREPSRWFGHIGQAEKLSGFGYDYCFFALSGSVVFPSFPDKKPWVLFDDQLNDRTATGANRFVPAHHYSPMHVLQGTRD